MSAVRSLRAPRVKVHTCPGPGQWRNGDFSVARSGSEWLFVAFSFRAVKARRCFFAFVACRRQHSQLAEVVSFTNSGLHTADFAAVR